MSRACGRFRAKDLNGPVRLENLQRGFSPRLHQQKARYCLYGSLHRPILMITSAEAATMMIGTRHSYLALKSWHKHQGRARTHSFRPPLRHRLFYLTFRAGLSIYAGARAATRVGRDSKFSRSLSLYVHVQDTLFLTCFDVF